MVTLRECVERICLWPRTYHSGQGTGIDHYRETGYEHHRESITQEQIAEFLRRDPALVTDWRYFSEDRRESRFWVFQPGEHTSAICFYTIGARNLYRIVCEDQFSACALMVRMEMEKFVAFAAKEKLA